MKQQEVWDSIAESWNNLRRYPSNKRVIDLANTWKSGNILDLGCGNGRHLIPFSKNKFNCYGIDFSKNMINNAKLSFKKNNLKAVFKQATLTKIPFKNNTFNYIICLASFHSLNKKEQNIALKEIKRVLKPDGKLFIVVWNKWLPKFILKNKEQMIPWKFKDNTYQRYYYLFNIFELKNLLKKHNFKIKKSYVDKNISILAEN